jgi:hypothetical protein
MVTIGGVTKGAVVDSGGFTSVSYVDAVAMGLLDASGNPVGTPTGTKTVNGVECNTFSVSMGYNPAKASPSGTLSKNGDPVTTTTDVIVPKKAADQSGTAAEKAAKRDSIPTKLGRDIVGVEITGKRLVPWDFGLDPGGSGKDIRGSKYAGAPLPSDILFLVESGPILADVLMNGISTSAGITFLPPTMVSPGLAQVIGFTATDTFTPDLTLQQSLFADGFINDLSGTAISLASGFADLVLPSTNGPYAVGQVAVVVDPELTMDAVLGSDALIPPFHGGYLDSDSFHLVSDAPEPSTLSLLAAALVGILWRARHSIRLSMTNRSRQHFAETVSINLVLYPSKRVQ